MQDHPIDPPSRRGRGPSKIPGKRRSQRCTRPGPTREHREWKHDTKTCKLCKQELPVDKFTWRKNRNKLWYRHSWCQACMYDQHKDWRDENKDGTVRDCMLRKYGLTAASYNAMLEKQGGVCEICKEISVGIDYRTKQPRRLAVDHCHTSGKVRALLCNLCNRGLGAFRDRPDLLRDAIAYLERHACRDVQ